MKTKQKHPKQTTNTWLIFHSHSPIAAQRFPARADAVVTAPPALSLYPQPSALHSPPAPQLKATQNKPGHPRPRGKTAAKPERPGRARPRAGTAPGSAAAPHRPRSRRSPLSTACSRQTPPAPTSHPPRTWGPTKRGGDTTPGGGNRTQPRAGGGTYAPAERLAPTRLPPLPEQTSAAPPPVTLPPGPPP